MFRNNNFFLFLPVCRMDLSKKEYENHDCSKYLHGLIHFLDSRISAIEENTGELNKHKKPPSMVNDSISSFLPPSNLVECVNKTPEYDLIELRESIESMVFLYSSRTNFSDAPVEWNVDPLFQIFDHFIKTDHARKCISSNDIRNFIGSQVYKRLLEAHMNVYQSILVRNIAILDFISEFNP